MNRISYYAACAVALVLCSQHAMAETHNHETHNHATENHTTHAATPIGVMGAHMHNKGEWMLGYSYTQSRTDGLLKGRDAISAKQAVHSYGEAPIRMDMKMHMLELMYGISDDLNIMVMPEYMSMPMVHQSHGAHGAHGHTISSLGDTKASVLYRLYEDANTNLHLQAGVSLPTGSSDEKFTNHHNTRVPLPYNMQPGSGTYDPILGATLQQHYAGYSTGVQAIAVLPVGTNDEGYRMGNSYTLNGWGSMALTEGVAASLRAEAVAWRDVNGQNAALPITSIVGADPTQQSGEVVNLHAGLTLDAGTFTPTLSGQQIGFEVGAPVYQRADGIQPEQEWQFSVGLRSRF